MDTVIIGGGLTGLLLTHRMHVKGHKVTLLEARDHVGGSLRRPAFHFFPATSLNLELCEWLKAWSPTPVEIEVVEHRPEIFDEGRWQAFAGFLNRDFPSLDALKDLSHTHEIRLSPAPDQILRALVEQLPVEAQTRSTVTEIKVTGECASELVINGDKSIRTEQIFHTGAPGALNELITGEALPAKHRSRLAKFSGWTAVVLELTHNSPIDCGNGIRLFGGSTKEFEPVFGRADGKVSRWLTLAHSERFEEHEFTGQCIRHIKRQLKRAWPDILDAQDNKPDEKIYAFAAAFGQNSLKTKAAWLMPEIPNLFLVSATLASQSGFMGGIEAVRGAEMLIDGSEFTEASLEG